jgi:hypothetical protein
VVREPPPDVVKHAYDDALAFYKATLQQGKGEAWLDNASSVQDVLDVLETSQSRFQSRNAKRWKPVATAVTWWKQLSSRMMQYETVVDSFISSNPEYAALVWGAMKFLFKVTLNYEECSSRLAQAFAEIGAVLPQAEFVSQLYPTARIRAALANTYAQIVDFCVRATKWYEKLRRTSIKKVLGAAFKTWPLEFQDIRNNIQTQFTRLRELSAIAHQAETRDINVRVIQLKALLNQARQQPFIHAFGRVTPAIRK